MSDPTIPSTPPSCAHDWKPVPNAMGKYQCAHCDDFGYRAGLSGRPQSDRGSLRGQIVPYADPKSPHRSARPPKTARPRVTYTNRRDP